MNNYLDGVLYSIPIDHITPNPKKNPRKTFEQEELETLTEEQLLELVFEWPAVAHGLGGAKHLL